MIGHPMIDGSGQEYLLRMAAKAEAKTVPENLRNCADIFEQRAAVYGDNYKRFGRIMVALFPGGLFTASVDDWNRLGLLVQMISKQTRYAEQFVAGGHPDSLDDLSVYAQMLQEVDAMASAMEPVPFDVPERAA